MWLPGARERDMGSYCLMGIKFLLGDSEKILEMDSDDGCTTLQYT